jgi:cytidylate kinase
MSVITINYQVGCGGHRIGEALAERLGYEVVDREIVQRVAQQLKISEATARVWDEHVESLVTRALTLFSTVGDAGYVPPVTNPDTIVDERAYFQTARAVIEAAARTQNVVIIGHAANFALAGRPDVLHLYLYAPVEQRVATMMAREGIDRSEAARRIGRLDHDRAQYAKRWYHVDWQDPLSYDLMLNTASVPPEQVVEIVVRAASQLKVKADG